MARVCYDPNWIFFFGCFRSNIGGSTPVDGKWPNLNFKYGTNAALLLARDFGEEVANLKKRTTERMLEVIETEEGAAQRRRRPAT